MYSEYVERPVHAALRERIVCTWVDPARQSRHPVLPDACIDIVWDGTRLQVAGPDTRAVPIASNATYAGIRFRPGAAPGFLGVSAVELVDNSVSLTDLWGRSAEELSEQLCAVSPEAAATILERTLLARLDSARPPDPLVQFVLTEVARPDTRTDSVHWLALRTEISERTLHRRCSDALGYGPKTLDRILRFRRALRAALSGSTSLSAAAAEAGYADQAHLTREVHRLAGVTPAQLVAQGRLALSSNSLN